MINLLPSETRSNLLYARKNHVLGRWLTYLFFGLVGVGVIVGIGVFYLSQTTTNLEQKTAEAKQLLQEQKIDETQAAVEELSNNVKLTTQVLSKEILFSKLLTQLGSVLPSNSSLSQLQIDKTTGPITIIALAKDYDSATQVQLNLSDPNNKIFQKAEIENISCADTSESSYPCTVQIKALFATDNPFLFISNDKKGSN